MPHLIENWLRACCSIIILLKRLLAMALRNTIFLPMGNLDSYKKHWTKDCRYVCNIYMARPGIVKLATAAQDKMRTAYHAME